MLCYQMYINIEMNVVIPSKHITFYVLLTVHLDIIV